MTRYVESGYGALKAWWPWVSLSLLLVLQIGMVQAAEVKRVQSGILSSNSAATHTVNITTVDPAKAFLIFQTRHSSNRPGGSAAAGRLGSASSLEFVTTRSDPIDIQWYLVEFASGVNVQRGEVYQNSATVNIPIIQLASLEQSFVTWSKAINGSHSTWGTDDPVFMQLTAINNLQLRSSASTSNHRVWWQVIEYTDAADIQVQRGTTTIASNKNDQTVAINPVGLSRSIVLAGNRIAADAKQINRHTLSAEFSDSDTLLFSRHREGGNVSIPEIGWQVIEFSDGTLVQSGVTKVSKNTLTETALLSPVNPNLSIALGSVQPAGGQNMGRTKYQGDDIPGVTAFTLGLTGNTLTLQRNSDLHEATIGWFVVEFPTPRLAEWRMDEASWGQVQDATGNGYHGTARNGAATAATTPAVPGSPGTCRYGTFDGVDDYVDLPGLPNLTGSFTITAWVRANELGKDQRIFADDQNNSGGFAFSLGDGGDGKLRFFSRQVNPISVDTQNAVISAGTWHHVAAVHDVTARTRMIYVDGVAVRLNNGSTSSVYTGTWGSDPGAASLAGENDAAGGEAVPNWRFNGSLDEVRIYSDALTQSQIQAVKDETRPCAAAGLDHIRLEHDGQGLTCTGETVTVRACVDAACNDLYTGEVTLDFSSPASGWNADPVTFSGGSASVSLSRTTVGTVVLDASASSPTATGDTQCSNSGGGNPCEVTFAATGILIDGDDGDGAAESMISTQIAGKPSNSGYGAAVQRVRVVRTDDQTGACVAGVANQTLDAVVSYLVPVASEGLGDNALSVTGVGSANLTAAGGGQTLQLAFDGNGTAPFSFNSQDAGRYQLRVEMAIPVVDPDGIPTGETVAASDTSNGFVVRPLAVYADATGNPRAQSAAGTAFKGAGEAFTLGYRSLRWVSGRDNDNNGIWDSCSSPTLADPGAYARLPAWTFGQAGADLQQPVGGNAGTLTHGGGDAAIPAGATSVDEGNVAYSEVGIIQLQEDSLNPFLGESVKLCSPYIGRFIPADFSFSITDQGVLENSCPAGSFSYAGTPIGYAALQLPTAIITARNSSGDITRNYTGAFMKLPMTGIDIPDITSDGSQLGADGVTRVGLSWEVGTPSLTDNGDGTLGFVLAGDTFTYGRTSNDRVAPFTSDVQLAVQGITDDDGVSATGLPENFTPTGVELRHGRMAMQNAQGSELLPLRVPLQVEYYAGAASGFVVNGADTCTTGVTMTLNDPLGQVVIAGGSRNTAIYAPAAVAGAFAAIDLSNPSLQFVQPPLAGEFNLHLQPSGQGNAGSTVVEVEVPLWLKYDWSGAGMADPSAKATFGVFSRPGGLIYQRETY
ncbi:LamG domain-containing protein [Sedimenticola hydrogenitrophicus]|uniref:LamG domain-containing protein n=1 Tax=Sedimenticola hydrogenitrophicus TaxID=2967975 RepID=UPI0021A524AB|nr:LamG domain-containing protein [Sedimenticola hydrogenitrophicus]